MEDLRARSIDVLRPSKRGHSRKKSDRADKSTEQKQTNSSNNVKRKSESIDRDEEPPHKKLQLSIPSSLTSVLVDNFENITRNKRIIPLPKKTTVKDIFDSFLTDSKRSPPVQELYREVANGLIQYFDRVLGTSLLYRFERPQHKALIEDRKFKHMSDCYGAEHLLRLFVQFPSVANQCFWKREEMLCIRQFTTELLKYLEKKKSQYFTYKYSETNGAYWAEFNDASLCSTT
jgi:mortality factor 4-like protein 1